MTMCYELKHSDLHCGTQRHALSCYQREEIIQTILTVYLLLTLSENATLALSTIAFKSDNCDGAVYKIEK